MAAIDFLKGSPLFYELYDDEIQSIVSHCMVTQFAAGEKVIKAGEEGTELYIILSGKAVAEVMVDGQRVQVASLEKGDLFGEMVLLKETKRSADIVTHTECDILSIDYDDIFKLYDKRPQVFAVLLLNMSRLLTGRLKSATETIQQLNAKLHEKKAA